MSDTTKSVIDAQRLQIQNARLLAEVEKSIFFAGPMLGPEGSLAPVIQRDNIRGSDQWKINFVGALSGAGTTSEATTIEDNEEALATFQDVLTVAPLGHGTRPTELAQLSSPYDLVQVSRPQLGAWIAGKIDDNLFTTLSATPLAGYAIYAGDATSRDTLDASDIMNTTVIDKAKAKAQEKLIRPFVMNGASWYGLVLDPFAAYDLKRDTTWANAQRDAGTRGELRNFLFTGGAQLAGSQMIGAWNGVLVWEAQRVTASNNANTPVIRVADNVFFGAQAGARGYQLLPELRTEFFDYRRKLGVAVIAHYGQIRIEENSKQVGCLTLYSAAVDPNA